MLKGTKGLFLMLAGVALFVLLVGLLTKANNGEQNVLTKFLPHVGSTTAVPSPNLKTIMIGKNQIFVTVADNDTTRSKGLSGISNLPTDQGMLFTFASKNITPSFWMKGMLIPLDFIWIKDSKVTEVFKNVAAPIPDTPDNKLTIYTPNKPIDYVLEVNAGFTDTNNIKAGDSVSLNF